MKALVILQPEAYSTDLISSIQLPVPLTPNKRQVRFQCLPALEVEVSVKLKLVSYDRLTKSIDEMFTKTSQILVLFSIIWSNFRHSFSFIDF